MNVAIFGSTGNTGQQLIKQALEQGHTVTAFARAPSKITKEHPNLRIVKGDALNISHVKQALPEQDAILCALGMPNIRDKSQLRSKATQVIIQAMQQLKVKRLICLSALGVGDSRPLLPMFYKYFLAPIFMHHLYLDHNLQEQHIQQSQLDWTIVRPGVLNNGQLTSSYQHGLTADCQSISSKISRSDTAQFMLNQLSSELYLHETPFLSY